jgi:hypothetical protein
MRARIAVTKVADYGSADRASITGRGRTFLSAITFRPPLGLTEPTVRINSPKQNLTIHLLLVPRLITFYPHATYSPFRNGT